VSTQRLWRVSGSLYHLYIEKEPLVTRVTKARLDSSRRKCSSWVPQQRLGFTRGERGESELRWNKSLCLRCSTFSLHSLWVLWFWLIYLFGSIFVCRNFVDLSAYSTFGVWTCIHLLALDLLCSLWSEWTRKFWVAKLGSSEFTCCLAQIQKLQTRKFWVWLTVNLIRCIWVKSCRCAYSPPL